MASGDESHAQQPNMTYSKFSYPFFGALIDYVETSLEYFRKKTFANGEVLHPNTGKTTLSPAFMAVVCLIMGFVCNVKLEVVTRGEALPVDLHFMLMSKENNFYVDDIDISKVIWCIEASDCVGLLISCVLICYSSYVPSPLSEYLFLPWLGVALRGMALRQVPTAGALVYTMAVVSGAINPLFVTAFLLLFLLEARLWLEVVRLLSARWDRRGICVGSNHCTVETLWANEDGQSVEVGSYVY